MVLAFTPPNHIKVKELLGAVRERIFADKKYKDYLGEAVSFVRSEVSSKEFKTEYIIYEIDEEDVRSLEDLIKEISLKNLLYQSRKDILIFSIVKITVSIHEFINYPDSIRWSVNYEKIKKTTESIDELKKSLSFYLQDRKIKEGLRRSLQSSLITQYVYNQSYPTYITGNEWIHNNDWYRLISDGRVTATNQDIMDWRYSYEIINKYVFLKKEEDKCLRKERFITYDFNRNEYKQHRAEIKEDQQKQLWWYDFDTKEFRDFDINKPKPIKLSIQDKSKNELDENTIDKEKKMDKKKDSQLINLETYSTPWLQVLNHVYCVHGEKGIKELSKKEIENTIQAYRVKEGLLINSETDIKYLAKFIRSPEQTLGKRYHDQRKKENLS